MAVTFKDGVILGADSRTTTGSYIANRVTDKLTRVHDKNLVLIDLVLQQRRKQLLYCSISFRIVYLSIWNSFHGDSSSHI